MGFWDSITSEGMFGNQGAAGSILGGLGTAAQIYQLYQNNQQQQDDKAATIGYKDAELAEQKRQFDLKYQLEQQKLAQAGGGGGGGGGAGVAAQVQAAHSRAIQGAYDSMIGAVETGRGGEAAVLSDMIDKIQKAYSAA